MVGQATEYVRVRDHGACFRFRFRCCPVCGSNVFPTEDGYETSFVFVVAFADPSFLPPRDSVYDFRRHPWVNLPPGTETHDMHPT